MNISLLWQTQRNNRGNGKKNWMICCSHFAGRVAYDMQKIVNDFSSEAKQNHSSIHQMDNRCRKRFAFEINRFCSCNANYYTNNFPFCLVSIRMVLHTKIHWALCGRPNFHWAIENFRKVNKQWKHLHTLIEREPTNDGGGQIQRDTMRFPISIVTLFSLLLLQKRKESSIWWAYARTYAPSCTQQKDSLTTRGDGKVFFRFFNGNALFWIPKRISLFRFNARSQHVHYSTHTHPHTRKKREKFNRKRQAKPFGWIGREKSNE